MVGPRLGTTTVTKTVPYTVNEHDAIEHRAVGTTAHTSFVPAPAQAVRLRASVDGQGASLLGVPQVSQSTFDEQTSALRPYTPSTVSHAAQAHLSWDDTWVPPYRNSRWAPFIAKHYFQPTTTTAPTHEYR